MKCPYIKPTIQQCINCSLPECARDEKADINQQKAEWRKNNPEKWSEIRKRYYNNHLEQERKRNRKNYQRNKEKILAAKKEKGKRINSPICDSCEGCHEAIGLNGKMVRMCYSTRLISGSVKTSPAWCHKRERQAG